MPTFFWSIRAAVEARHSRREACQMQRRQENHQQPALHITDAVEQVMERGDHLQRVEQGTGRLSTIFYFVSIRLLSRNNATKLAGIRQSQQSTATMGLSHEQTHNNTLCDLHCCRFCVNCHWCVAFLVHSTETKSSHCSSHHCGAT